MMYIVNKFIEHFLLPFCLVIICVIFYNGEYLKSTSNECPSYPKYENLNEAADTSTFYSSVFCRGSNHTDRLCHFRNLCYEPKSETFLVFHRRNSIISGVPHDRFDPALADFSSVADHNTQYFNYVDLPASAVQNFNISYIKGHSLMFKRFNPENLMHVFHDDLLPAFLTLKELCRFGVGMSCKDVFFTFADGRASGPYADLYNKFLNNGPLYLKSLSSKNLHCIQNVYVGLNKLTTWYHYGFKEPQGPLKKPFTGIYSIILEFRNYFIEQFNLNPKDEKPLAVLLTRKHNRKILNENEVMKTLQMYSDLETCVMNLENHSVLEVIKIVLQSKIIVGMHGSLLIVSLFLEPNSIIVELFPFGVNPDISTPYKTLANIPGLKLIYWSWENKIRNNSVPHPEYSVEYGGIQHLPKEEQVRIQNSVVVPFLCCYDPVWLYRIYQDTIVDINSFTIIVSNAIKELKMQISSDDELVTETKLYPSEVQNVSCTTISKNSTLNISWDVPWNLQFMNFSSIEYELWLQAVESNQIQAFLMRKQIFRFSMNSSSNSYYIWIRCHVDGKIGPFNSNPFICHQ